MPPRRRGRPRSSPADRARRLRLRNVRRARRAYEADYLRRVASQTQGPRRSLRIQWLEDNRDLLRAGYTPFYWFILYGEPGFFEDDEDPPTDGYHILVR